jgi:3-dehydroquinate synthase
MKRRLLGRIRPERPKRTDIFISHGIVEEVRPIADILQKHRLSNHVVISDRHVYGLHGKNLVSRLKTFGLTVSVCLVPRGENSKSMAVYQELVNRILLHGIDKNSYLITLGGGMVNNLGGFLAATLYRGINLIHIPTSLMAQVDAAVDRKQAINHSLGKNLLGSLYSPVAILIDPKLLRTLPVRQLRNGIAESIKHALTQSASFFRFLVNNASSLRDIRFLEAVVKRTIRLKLSLMNRTNSSNSGEFIMQYGHCVGHALEHGSKYKLSHGEAIAIGMSVSAEVSLLKEFCNADLVEAHDSILSRYRLPTTIPNNMSVEDVLKIVAYDKGILCKTPRLTLLRRIGKVHESPQNSCWYVDWDVLENALRKRKKLRT